jgi:hypothetical protein
VNTVEDFDVPNYVWNQGKHTLRTAIRLANAAGGSTTIQLAAADGKKDYKLTKPLPTVTSTLVISGDGDVTKIWGPCKKAYREPTSGHCDTHFSRSIFEVLSSGNLTLSSLAIHNGWSEGGGAGAVVSEGTLTLDRVTIVGSGTHIGAGAVFVGAGTATIDRSTIRENTTHHGPAGGIYVAMGASLTITNSTISGNRSVASDFGYTTQAGGIANEGSIAIQSTTITRNAISKDKMDSPFNGEAGGIANAGEAWLNSVTIAGNSVVGVKNNAGGHFFFFSSLIAAPARRRPRPGRVAQGRSSW